MKKSCFIILLALAFSLGNSFKVKANHIIGAEFAYRNIGVDTVRLILSFYSDCNASTAGYSTPFTLITGCSTNSYTIYGSLAGGADITPTCKHHCTSCTYSSPGSCNLGFGVKQYYLSGTALLHSYNCCNYTFYWEQCCRSSALSTLKTSSITGYSDYYISCSYNSCKSNPTANAFIFANPALLFVCRDQCYNEPQTVSALSGDSIHYKMITPLEGINTRMVYNTPYDSLEPLKCDSAFSGTPWDSAKCIGMKYDPVSGYLHFKPKKEDYTELALVAEQWHKDNSGKYQLAGSITRSVGLQIVSCSNAPPAMSNGFDGKGGHTMYLFANAPFKFDITTTDGDAGDTLSLSWSKTIPNASFTVNKWLKPTGTFAWMPKVSDISKTRYYFKVTVDDNHCPIPINKSQYFDIYVTDSFPKIKESKIDSGCGRFYFSAISDTSKHLVYKWDVNGDTFNSPQKLSYQFKQNGTYVVHVWIGNKYLSGKDFYDTVVISTVSQANAGADVYLCKNTKTTLIATGGNKYKWSPSTGLSSDTARNAVASPTVTTKYVLTATSAYGCKSYDTVQVKVSDLYLSTYPDKLNVCGKQGGTGTATIHVYWPKHKKIRGIINAPGANLVLNDTGAYTMHVSKSGIISVYIEEADSGCSLTDTCKLTVSIPVANAGQPKTICKGDSVQLNGSGGVTYLWKSAPGIRQLNVASPYVKPVSDQMYNLTITDSMGCTASDSVLVKVVYPQSYAISQPAMLCKGDTALFNISGPKTYSYNWHVSKYLKASTDGTSLKAFPDVETTYYVDIVDKSNGCRNSDSIKVSVDNDCVYPGDANKDKKVNYLDLLPIGVGFNANGPKRNNASIVYTGQPCTNWSNMLNSINYKHLDCNGDGVIDYKDTMAIVRNYGALQKNTNLPLNTNNGNTLFDFGFDKRIYVAGDTVRAALYFGTVSKSTGVLGGAFSYQYGSNYMSTGTYQFAYNCDFFCSSTPDLNIYRSDNQSSGEGAFVRTDHSVSNGYGKIADISYVLLDSNSSIYGHKVDTLRLNMMSAKAIDDKGNDLPLDAQSAYALIYRTKADIPSSVPIISVLKSLSIYPNPFNNEFTLSLQLQRQARVRISCFDALGREVSKLIDKDLPSANNTFNFQDREAGMKQPGIYFIKIQVDDEVSVMRMVKM